MMQTLSAAAEIAAVPSALPARRALAVGTVFVVCYVLLSLASRHYMVRPFGITPWNPNAGFALALLLVYGGRFWPALAIAACTSNLLIRGIPQMPYTQLLLPLTVTAAYAGMAALLRGPLGFRLEFDRLRDVIALLIVAALGTLLVAIIVASVIRITYSIPDSDVNLTILRSWTGHLLGIVINTPLLLMLANWRQVKEVLHQVRHWEAAAQMCAVILSLWVIFGSGWADPYKQFYLLFLPLIWVAMRHGIIGTICVIAVLQLGFIAFVVQSTYDAGMAVTEFQFMMLALAVTGLFMGMVVSESGRARNALKESEAHTRAIVSTAQDGILTIGQHGMIVAVNPAAGGIFNCQAEELIGKHVCAVLPGFDKVAAGGEACEISGARSDGSRFPVEISVGLTERKTPALQIVITRDITRRKSMERQLSQAARLAAAGEMAAALAHELHQPLSAIRNYAHATQALQMSARGSDLPRKIEHEAARAAEIVQRLRDFFRDGSSSFEYITVKRLVDGALAPMREEAARLGIALTAHIACDEVNLLVDRVQLEAVIHCIVSNAFDSIAGAGQQLREVRLDVKLHDSASVQVSIADTGTGVKKEILDHLFEPFATSKITGIGMGLAMSRAIVEGCEGELWAEAGARQGAVFHFTLPCADRESADAGR